MESNSKAAHSVGKTIARLRREHGWTQLELGRLLSVSDKTVSKWEMENGYPEITLIPVIAEIFGISIDYLLTGRGVKECEPKSEEPSDSLHVIERQDSSHTVRTAVISSLISTVLAVLLALTFTLFIPLYRQAKADTMLKDGNIDEAIEVYSSLGVLADGKRRCSLARSISSLLGDGAESGVKALLNAGASVVVSYDTAGGRLEEPTLTPLAAKNGNTVKEDGLSGIRRIVYNDPDGFVGLCEAERNGYRFIGWSITEYSYDIEDKIAPFRLSLRAEYTEII